MDSNHPSWKEALIDIVIDFTEAAVHSLLHARRVYPQAIFERRRKYGVPVWMSRHPGLNDYIYQVLLRTKDLVSQGIVRKILVCFFEEGTHDESRVLEKVAFELSMDPKGTVSGASGEPGLTSKSQDKDSVDHSTLQDIEDQLRSALLQIGKSSAHLPSRQGCTFGLHVQAQEGASVGDGGEDHENRDGASTVRSALRGGHWLLADGHAQGVMTKSGQRFLVPIKSVRGPGLRLDLSSEMGDCYVES